MTDDVFTFMKEVGTAYGPMALILGYMFYKDWIERREMRQRVTRLETFQLNTLIPLLAEHNKTLVENTNMFKEIAALLKALAGRAPTETYSALEKIGEVVTRRDHDNNKAHQTINMEPA